MGKLKRRDKRGQTAAGLVGSLEYAALCALWEQAPANVNAVLDRINHGRKREDRLAYTTVMTVLARLYEKGILDRVKAGRGYDYTPRFDEAALIRHLGQQEVTGLVDRYGAVALAHFAAALEDADPVTRRRIAEAMAEAGDA
ncbi:MAG: BlaI/MecI/CopY family transcriptional regulator [Actinobacteria bacterium]|nr:BlaI/MecI/CopY family transcriptional regulator [Actinomycetota bacterium]